MMKTLPLAIAISLAGHAALADEDALTTAHAALSVSMTIAGGVIAGGTSGANGITGSFGDATGPIAILQNSGRNAVQVAQSVMALRVPCYCIGPMRVEAAASQIAFLSVRDSRIEKSAASGSNTISGSFANASGAVIVMQNTGTNAVQSAQNTVALAVR